MNIWKDVLLTMLISIFVALVTGILLIRYIERTQIDCMEVPLDEIHKTECRR